MASYQRFSVFIVWIICFSGHLRLSTPANVCLGTGCYCTEYPVTISCTDGHPDILKTLLKRVAVSMSVEGESTDQLLHINLDDYISLKQMDIKIYKMDACLWGMSKRMNYKRIKFTLPDFCKYFNRMIQEEKETVTESLNDDEQTSTTHKTPTEKLTLVIHVSLTQLIGCMLLLLIVGCLFSLLRTYVR